MKHNFKHLYIILALGLLVPYTAFSIAGESPTTLSRQVLLQKKVSLPSSTVDAKVIRVQFPKGYKTPLHTHEGPGPRYVVKGQLRVEDSGESHVFSTGEVFWETGAEMTVENIGGSDAEIVIFELAPAK